MFHPSYKDNMDYYKRHIQANKKRGPQKERKKYIERNQNKTKRDRERQSDRETVNVPSHMVIKAI